MSGRRLLASMIVLGIWSVGAAGNAIATELSADCATRASETQSFDGNTPEVTEPFILPAGIFVVTGSYEGEGIFQVQAYDEAGNHEWLFIEIGPYTGETTLRIESEAKVILDIDANNGAWEISVAPAF